MSVCIESACESSAEEEPASAIDSMSDVTTDTVYSNLANLLTALQSVRPAGHTLDVNPVNNVT